MLDSPYSTVGLAFIPCLTQAGTANNVGTDSSHQGLFAQVPARRWLRIRGMKN